MPGIGATACFRRAMMSSTLARRSSRGLQRDGQTAGVRRRIHPADAEDRDHAGDVRILLDRGLDLALQPLHLGERDLGPASVTAMISPVSCDGRKPFGMTT